MPCETDVPIIRSGTRIRESIRCLPRGHFQQIRQMFDKQSSSRKPLTTIHERRSEKANHSESFVVLQLAVTDDEKLPRTVSCTNVGEHADKYRSRGYLPHCPVLRAELVDESTASGPCETRPATGIVPCPSASPSEREEILLTPDQRRQLAMAAAINYADSYDPAPTSRPFNRVGSTRQYVASLQRAQAKPVLVKTTPKANASIIYDTNNDIFHSAKRLQSSASLSSTGYDSNSSPSILSKRNSLVTNQSIDFSSSSEERQRSQPWTFDESSMETPGTIAHAYSSEDVFDSPLLASRSYIKFSHSPTSTLERRPVSVTRHASIRQALALNSPSISSTSSSSSAKYIVQTTTFPESTSDVPLSDPAESDSSLKRKHTLRSIGSTGFQVQQRLSLCSPVVVQKHATEREESPLPVVENPLFQQAPPIKPPRTFEHETRYGHLAATTDQKVPSSSSSESDSPTFDLGARSVSCMDLTVGVSSALLTSGLLPLDRTPRYVERKPVPILDGNNRFIPNENIYEELKTPLPTLPKSQSQPASLFTKRTQTLKSTTGETSFQTPTTRQKINRPLSNIKSALKKGVSEPNLAKTKPSPSSTFFSPRGLLNRFKRILPLSLSKQSLNEKSVNESNAMTIDSDDSTSTTSENNDDVRTSKLDHVSRVKNVYDSLGSGSHLSSLFSEPSHVTNERELKTLYDYVVHILPEQELGYFANGTGCLSLSNLTIDPQSQTSTAVRFKYPSDAYDEPTLKYFCFPDQHDSNNNPSVSSIPSPNRARPEYFRFTLTDMRGIRQHGYCSRFLYKGVLNALCLVSPCDMIDLYEKVIATATELFLSYKEEDAKRFLQEIYPHRLPTRGDTIHIHTTTVGLYTLKCEYDRRKQLIDSVAVLSLSTDTIIKIFSSILYEQKLIFIADELGPLTRLINTFTCLLYPFSWPHTYVPVLPALMLDVLQAPTPYVIGILRSCEHYLSDNEEFLSQDNSDVLIVDIDHDRIYSINDYLPNESTRGSLDNLHQPVAQYQILPKIFKVELKQEISFLRKNQQSLSLDECQQRLRNVFMSVFVQSCYNYKDHLAHSFDTEQFIQSKQRTIELFLEWFTRTQIFELFIREKVDCNTQHPFAVSFDLACDAYRRTLNKQTSQRVTVKSVKRKAAGKANKQDHRL